MDPDFGSGCVKITPAHDFNDYRIGARHALPKINIFTIDAKINENAPERYQGLDRYEARERIVADLKEQGLLERAQPHKYMIPRGDRSNSVVEPYLTDQWFVRAQPLAAPALSAVERGEIRFVPGNWSKTYFEWMRSIEDWCISRQLWWGHRIPAWYDPDGRVYVGHSEADVRAKHGIDADVTLTQDPDVLDTWFSSALWPFSTLGWPEQTERLKTFYPTSVLVTGFDIIFFWVARMIMMGLRFRGEVPFREVYIHGLVRDADGNKMSKSKGNILDPLDLSDGIELDALIAKRTAGLMQPHMAPKIEKSTRRQFPKGIPAYGTDALRFTFCSLATTGRDIRFDLGRIEGYRNFCNKLWNATRFVLLHSEGKDCGLDGQDMSLSLADRWIRSLLQTVEQKVRDAIEHYRFDHAAQAIYEFTWNEYCDWYLELCKPILLDENASAAALRATRCTLVGVLEALLRLAHPLIPFITEEIWQRVAPLAGKTGKTIMQQPFPEPELAHIDHDVMEEMAWLKSFVLGVRQVRGEMDIAPSRALTVLLQNGNDSDRKRLDDNRHYLETLARLESIDWLTDAQEAPEAAMTLVGDMKLLIPMSGLIDKDAEAKRRKRELEKLRRDRQRSEDNLANPNFVERAPEDIVRKERARLDELDAAITRLEEQDRL